MCVLPDLDLTDGIVVPISFQVFDRPQWKMLVHEDFTAGSVVCS